MSGIPISCLIFALFVGSAPAQTTVSLAARPAPSAAKLPPSDFRVEARMVQIPVTVTDSLDRNVMNLNAGNFRIFDGDVEQRISSFSMTDAPISTGIVFDTSGSMKHRIQDSRAAVKQFLATAVPDDEFSLVQFADTATLLSGFTRNPAAIEHPLGSMAAHGWTALYDAMFLAMHQIRRAANPRRVLLVLSDGEDNNSRYTEAEMMSLVREADVTVYAIGLFTRARGLERMTEETGGRMITVHNLPDLPAAMEKLSREIRNQYMLGYFPSRAGSDGRYRKVRVEVNLPAGSPPLRTSWRRGYFVPDN
ncbi:MAG: VWA domain-containing protein [Candidatus Sulfopaludibacter sp.]|nr:VWA domain-containing protein [Candidatus Sulfopaludibacter sp.]